MSKIKKSSKLDENLLGRPALTPEAQENKMISLAMKAAEQQLMDGTASSQIIVHYLKLGTLEKRLELEKLKNENALIEAKTKMIQDSKRTEELYLNALNAMRMYSGQDSTYDQLDIMDERRNDF